MSSLYFNMSSIWRFVSPTLGGYRKLQTKPRFTVKGRSSAGVKARGLRSSNVRIGHFRMCKPLRFLLLRKDSATKVKMTCKRVLEVVIQFHGHLIDLFDGNQLLVHFAAAPIGGRKEQMTPSQGFIRRSSGVHVQAPHNCGPHVPVKSVSFLEE